ncbi:rRNA-processing protein UTP23 homolog [Babesia caballi]|uniref:rRNA-processing protein UTP23 homolog n=1 Tax=Babesia caballi TaxID=5871 RepID=A0AAV4LPQ0_BABCB|nr:rRNA-processing protein UTP23 homolog [Babesia caballi]
MKAGKNKRIKRTLDFYRQLYDLTEPYRVLVDGSFAFAALKHRIHIKDHLAVLLGGTTHAYVTNCIINELRDMGDEMSGASLALKRYQRLNCTHPPSDKGPNSRRCITSAVSDGNPQKLFVATQDQTLITWLRKSGDVPILKLNNNVVFLEHPGKSSKAYKEMVVHLFLLHTSPQVEKGKLLPKEWEKAYLPVLSTSTGAPTKRKRKKNQNPNPLSCLKSKKKVSQSAEAAEPPVAGSSRGETAAPKRKRRRKAKSEATLQHTDTAAISSTETTE